jgi:hypothetical protein
VGTITRRDLLKTGVLALTGVGFGAAPAPLAKGAVCDGPPKEELHVLQINVLPWEIDFGERPKLHCCGMLAWTLVLTLHSGLDEEPITVLLDDLAQIEGVRSRVAAIHGFATCLDRDEIMGAIMKDLSEIDVTDNNWERVAREMEVVIHSAEDCSAA